MSTERTVFTQSGLLVVDKPSGLTSHDVVARARKLLGTRAVGHAGTLDPMATGVLVLGVNRATKLLGHLALNDKAYLATIRLGASTTSDDAEGETVSTADASAVTDDAIARGIVALTGPIQQVPSSVSAVKVDGKRAYQRVREGERVELPPRPVTVARFDVLATRREDTWIDLDVMVECSTGTYVRALARDLGAGLGVDGRAAGGGATADVPGVGGHLTALRRTRVGPFGLLSARTLDQLAERPGLSLDLDAAVAAAFVRRDVDADGADDLAHGRPLATAGITGTHGVFGPDGHAVGLVAERDGASRPVLVLRPAGG